MYNAINDILSLDYEKVILIGSDIPHIKMKIYSIPLKILGGKRYSTGTIL